jgi:hypothetical protein
MTKTKTKPAVKPVHKGKINRHERVAQVLLSGKEVSPDEIRAVFKGDPQETVLYRLSTNIYNIRKDGGVVKVHKDGRNVKAYQLVNVDQFDKNGRFVGNKVAPVAIEAPVAAEPVKGNTRIVY